MGGAVGYGGAGMGVGMVPARVWYQPGCGTGMGCTSQWVYRPVVVPAVVYQPVGVGTGPVVLYRPVWCGTGPLVMYRPGCGTGLGVVPAREALAWPIVAMSGRGLDGPEMPVEASYSLGVQKRFQMEKST